MKSTILLKRKTAEEPSRPRAGAGRYLRPPVEDPAQLLEPTAHDEMGAVPRADLPDALSDADLRPITRALLFAFDPVKRHTALRPGAGVPAFGHARRTVRFRMPEHLRAEYWMRHELSADDIRRTFEGFSPQTLWRALLVYQVPTDKIARTPLTKSVAQACADLEFGIAFDVNGKPTVIDHLLKFLAYDDQFSLAECAKRPAVTWNMTREDDPNGDGRRHHALDAHLPVVAVHRVSEPCLVAMSAHEITTRCRAADRAAAQKARAWLRAPFPFSDSLSTSSTSTSTSKPMTALELAFAPQIYLWRGIWLIVVETCPASESLRVGRVAPWDDVYARMPDLVERVRIGIERVVDSPAGPLVLLHETFYLHATTATETVVDADGRVVKRPRASDTHTHTPTSASASSRSWDASQSRSRSRSSDASPSLLSPPAHLTPAVVPDDEKRERAPLSRSWRE